MSRKKWDNIIKYGQPILGRSQWFTKSRPQTRTYIFFPSVLIGVHPWLELLPLSVLAYFALGGSVFRRQAQMVEMEELAQMERLELLLGFGVFEGAVHSSSGFGGIGGNVAFERKMRLLARYYVTKRVIPSG